MFPARVSSILKHVSYKNSFSFTRNELPLHTEIIGEGNCVNSNCSTKSTLVWVFKECNLVKGALYCKMSRGRCKSHQNLYQMNGFCLQFQNIVYITRLCDLYEIILLMEALFAFYVICLHSSTISYYFFELKDCEIQNDTCHERNCMSCSVNASRNVPRLFTNNDFQGEF